MYFSLPEYHERLSRVRAMMDTRGLDLLLLFGQEAVNYLSGFYSHGHFAGIVLGVPRVGPLFLVVRQMEEMAARETSWIADLLIYNDHENALDYVVRAVEARALQSGTIGLDLQSWYLTAERYLRLVALLPGATLQPIGDVLERMRILKSPAELDKVRRAGRAVSAGLQAALAATRPGVTENDVAAEMAAARIRAGGGLPIDGVVTTGPRTLQGHGPWTDRIIEHGDQFYYEVHGICDHYWTRSIRSGVVGRASERQRFVFDVLKDAQDRGLAQLKPGASGVEVDRACRDRLIESGLYERASFTRRTGYSMGLMFRPTPGDLFFEFTAKSDFVVQPGMVFMMLVLAEGLGLADTYIVTDSGTERVTTADRTLLEIGG